MTESGKLVNLIHAIEHAVSALVRQKHASFDIFSLGATGIDPPTVLRDGLKHDAIFMRAIRAILESTGSPADAIPQVAVVVQSEETVSRDYRGNWWYAVK